MRYALVRRVQESQLKTNQSIVITWGEVWDYLPYATKRHGVF